MAPTMNGAAASRRSMANGGGGGGGSSRRSAVGPSTSFSNGGGGAPPKLAAASLAGQQKPGSRTSVPAIKSTSGGKSSSLLRFRGHQHLRQRLVLSILSGRSVRIDGIRSSATDVHVGLTAEEASFLRLLEKITNGSTVEISYTGTTVLFHPGLLPGGQFEHKCPTGRGIGWFLEGILPLASLGKRQLEIKFEGVTGVVGKGDEEEMSCDMLRTVALPHLHLFGIRDGLELSILRRGLPPLGGGSVLFRSPLVRSLTTLDFVDPGKIRRIRGIAHSCRVSPQFANRMVEAARGVLNRYIPDIYLYTDVRKGEEAGKSPGYGLTIVSTTTVQAVVGAEAQQQQQQSAAATTSQGSDSLVNVASSSSSADAASSFATPEDLGAHVARLLLDRLSAGFRCVHPSLQSMVLTLMTLGPEDVARCRLGPVTANAVRTLRDLDAFFGTRFKVSLLPKEKKKKGKGTTNKLVNGPNVTRDPGAEQDQDDEGSSEDDSGEEDGTRERTVLGVPVRVRVRDTQNQGDDDDAAEITDESEGEDGSDAKAAAAAVDEYVVSCLGIGYGNINRSAA